MAKVFDFRNGKSSFFLEQLLTASLVRTASLENPNIVVKRSKKELRASQLRLPRALPNDCCLAPIPQPGTKARGKSYLSWAQRCTAIHGPYWKNTELEHKFLALTRIGGERHACNGRGGVGAWIFLLVLSKHKTPVVERRKTTGETNILDNVYFSKFQSSFYTW